MLSKSIGAINVPIPLFYPMIFLSLPAIFDAIDICPFLNRQISDYNSNRSPAYIQKAHIERFVLGVICISVSI